MPTGTGQDNLYDGGTTGSGSCQTGTLTFAVPTDEIPASLRYYPWYFFHYEWPLPGG